jgi:DNA-directed RNA polymerase specialized sigma24 family protein
MLDALPFPDDFLLAQQCLEGDALAIRRLEDSYGKMITGYLKHSGANEDEAIELTGFLWADILGPRQDRGPRLATYAGNSSLLTWLKAVALNNLVQWKRHVNRVRQPDIDKHDPEDFERDGMAKAAVVEMPNPDTAPLLEIMRGAVETAFRQCDPEAFVLLQLAHANGLRGRELAHMYGCSEAKISRSLDEARHCIAAATLAYVRAQDPWLELQWDDFIELCRVVSPACFGVE